MTTYKITTTVAAPAVQREQLRTAAAREVYKSLLKYHSEKALGKSA